MDINAVGVNLWAFSYCVFSHDVIKIQSTIDPPEILLSWNIRAAENYYSNKFSRRMGSWFCDSPRFRVTWLLHDGQESCDVGQKSDLFQGIRLSEHFLY